MGLFSSLLGENRPVRAFIGAVLGSFIVYFEQNLRREEGKFRNIKHFLALLNIFLGRFWLLEERIDNSSCTLYADPHPSLLRSNSLSEAPQYLVGKPLQNFELHLPPTEVTGNCTNSV